MCEKCGNYTVDVDVASFWDHGSSHQSNNNHALLEQQHLPSKQKLDK